MPIPTAIQGFTLVEVLVVISIIVVLAALSFMGVSRMRNSADRVIATRNLSQLQIANASYAADHNGCFVDPIAFDGEGKTYTSWAGNPEFVSMLVGERSDADIEEIDAKLGVRMPQSLLDPVALKARKLEYDRIPASYGCNVVDREVSWGKPGATSKKLMITQLGSPARTAAFLTATDFQAKYEGRFVWKDAAAVEGYTKDGKIAYRYGKKAMVVYYDGHVGEVSQADMKKFDEQCGATNVFWNARK
jgi:prepilin-type N-terminal cleavage/methylation domain-containing protein/prepilin-type processing-associated H-X9-DG protein